MSFNFNEVILVGRLTRDPEYYQLSDTLSKSNFTVAVSRPYRREDGGVDTDFIPVVTWGKTAEVANQILKKGSPILVNGRIQIRKFEKNDEPRYATEVVAERFQILEKKRKEGTEVTTVEDKQTA